MTTRYLLVWLAAVLLPVTYGSAESAAGSSGDSQEVALTEQVIERTESWGDRVRREGAYLEVSLRDVIRLALTNNLELAIEEFSEDLNRERIVQTQGFYDPVLSFEQGWTSSESPTTSILQAGAGIDSQISRGLYFRTSLRQNVIGGGVFQLDFNNNRSASNNAFAFVNPNFNTAFDLSFTQPLLRGFRETPTERQLKLINLDTEISDSHFKQRVAEVVQQVQNQYWELVFAIDNFETQRQSVELAIIQYENNRKRVEIGVTAPIEITAARTEVASREQTMIQSEVQIITAQNGLKRLLAPDPTASIWNLTLIPNDRPQMREMTMTLDEAIGIAMRQRPELEQVRYELEKNAVDRRYLDREGKPAVDLVARFGSIGRAGQVFRDVREDTTGDGIPDRTVGREPDPSHPLFGNFSDAMGSAFGFNYRNYEIGVRVEIPLRNRTNEANLALIGIEERRWMSRTKDLQQAIMVDVRNAYQAIATQRKSLEAARVARQLSEERLEGENKRFEAGLSTNFEVLSFQRDLADARVRELRALIDYQLALTALEKATYTIVDGNDIVMARNKGDR